MNDTFSPIIQTIAEIIGEEEARVLAEKKAGQRVYVPATPGDEHMICQIIRCDSAKKLARIFGGQTIEMPSLAGHTKKLRNEQIANDARTMTRAQLAEKWRLSQRHIKRILNQLCTEDANYDR